MRLRELVEEKGITQKKVAEELGWPRRTLNNYVLGAREPDLAAISAICDYFGCSADYLLGRSSYRNPTVTEEQAAFLRTYEALPLEIRRAVDGLMEPYRQAAEQKTGS